MSNRINVLDHGFVDLISKSEDPALGVVNAARISYNKKKQEFDERDKKLARFLWSNSHTSPFRHCYYTFHIKFPLFVARQWIKHQVGCAWRSFSVDGHEVCLETFEEIFDTDKGCSWNEVSGRYVELDEEFYIPDHVRQNAVHGNKQVSVELGQNRNSAQILEDYELSCRESYRNYKRLIRSGMSREQARGILTQNIYTQAYWTCSLQALLHFFSLRLKDDAQYEIRIYAEAIKRIVSEDLDKLEITL